MPLVILLLVFCFRIRAVERIPHTSDPLNQYLKWGVYIRVSQVQRTLLAQVPSSNLHEWIV